MLNKYNPEIHNRHTIRLPEYDYSQKGMYYVTICTYRKACIFGSIKDSKVILNQIGKIAREELIKTEKVRKAINIDTFIIMPNHIHVILLLSGCCSTLPEIIRGFKTFSSRRINNLRKQTGSPLWQRNYYEHIIRDEEDLMRVREYITQNPLKWETDEYYAI